MGFSTQAYYKELKGLFYTTLLHQLTHWVQEFFLSQICVVCNNGMQNCVIYIFFSKSVHQWHRCYVQWLSLLVLVDIMYKIYVHKFIDIDIHENN